MSKNLRNPRSFGRPSSAAIEKARTLGSAGRNSMSLALSTLHRAMLLRKSINILSLLFLPKTTARIGGGHVRSFDRRVLVPAARGIALRDAGSREGPTAAEAAPAARGQDRRALPRWPNISPAASRTVENLWIPLSQINAGIDQVGESRTWVLDGNPNSSDATFASHTVQNC